MNSQPTANVKPRRAAVVASHDDTTSPVRADLTRLRDEVARLHQESARMRAEGVRLREENARLREDIDDLRASASHWRDLYEAASLRRLQAFLS